MPDRRDFAIGDTDFLLAGAPFRILSGALHYFRVHPGLWADRIEKARLLGLNTIETYVPWNLHEPHAGTFDLEAGLDLPRFLDLVGDAGMLAIVRPGPFICAELDGGGLPAWLFREPGVGVRRNEPGYLAAVESWFGRLLPVVAERQVTRGGNVVLVQVENEYGAYGDDATYLKALAAMFEEAGIDVPLFTCDQPEAEMLEAGGLPGVLRTATFGSRSVERLASLREHQPTGPLMCAEYWNGWFDSWGEVHHVTDAAAQAADLDALLATGASVNLYMFHGGTNAGLTNGANHKGIYRPIATSYDYDAPLSEDGWPTAKFHAFRDVISRYAAVPDLPVAERQPVPTPTIRLTGSVALEDVVGSLGEVVESDGPLTMDAVGHYRGFCDYRSDLPARQRDSVLTVPGVRDRAVVSVGGVVIGTLSREFGELSVVVPAGPAAELSLLVEDQGRVNYGPRIGEPKGVVGDVLLDGVPLHGWRIRPLALGADLDASHVMSGLRPDSLPYAAGPSFVAGEFALGSASDLHLATEGLTKGLAWVNGHCLGRYWSRGPQRTLYVPGPVTRVGRNEVLLVELQGGSAERVRFEAWPDLGPDEP